MVSSKKQIEGKKIDDHRQLLQPRRRRGDAASRTDRFGSCEIPQLNEVRNIVTWALFRDSVRYSRSKH